ncbi:CusA/CzcA family heavy metal efflux RND transporter [Flavobacterium ardleyense]|uniref:CusA/CzcA family heavy metal efflux RND transporter n=1 Tax=Flavobacterium ardleyense TaxID=2038737 RepID=UPI00298D07DB|nr:CusA/CzcA family heavy metal efflux RND transporter [Flavobacterium ardleyense]
MLDKIIHFSISNKFIIGLFTLVLIIVGAYSAYTLPIDALPDITNNQVQIITTSPNLATQDVEQFITYPIEQAVKPIPNVVELRSISRFGLSVITVVFTEDTDIYWARAQISERLKEAESSIPTGMGAPEMAPVSTGLGEIYQYIVFPKPGFEDKFDAIELRMIQDWIIKPQLIGTKGVAEVNTLGGKLKQYEISVNPDKLKSMDITIVDIFEALEKNNENTGGAYIDKKPYAYFIRAIGMLTGIDDINKIVVKNQNGIPILMRDVATVQVGSSIRYGAVTKDGQGEDVQGMVMMLKGENSGQVVNRVKEKMEQIKKSLPEGVDVVAFMDRSQLVDRAISTVEKNLIEGALIVIFILVLLLGNWRAGLVVASVIPLALLFAISMMKLFGVSGNLMSLGAIDFGLIVDGAVIIVESIVHRLQIGKKRKLSRVEMDEEVFTASSKIRNSAAFGEIIILIVYLPILALVGIEGKMFGPMAMTVSFAILGAFILSLTYVPMMAALALKKETGHTRNYSDKIIDKLHSWYTPLLDFAMKFKREVLAVTIAFFALSLVIFNTLGGEFIPSLDEGDIATHLIIASGSSLSQEIESTTKAEQILKAKFPEIKMIVSKIGSAEIPTDPMPMEAADVMIILKDKSEWTSAETKEELMKMMEKELEVIPGAITEFSQPIQMRFNELMTGVRSDVAIKIFGEDIDLLVSKGDEVLQMIQNIKGVTDPQAERVAGLPQIVVRYNKDKMAYYGLNVGDLNRVVRMGFAGEVAGNVYEGEKRFDLVVRLDQDKRQDISNLRSLFVTLPNGNQVPLDQVADIAYEDGPMQISREDGKRRIVVGFNVRGEDVKTVVNTIQEKLDAELKLPDGYYTTFGGQFENLIEANKRLAIAVPMALGLIFILLYFTFKSVKQSLMIFTAIPLSAIGGIIALWLRDMPFSISAGVGFIALFGVAVLNGIVLIGYFNQLKAEGMADVLQRIKEGTKVRLRPVILTASVASMGFLPMALSTSAGAEVQKPLATVVIGGLITATFLTLIILPILYYLVEKKSKIKSTSAVVILLFLGLSAKATAQETPILTLQSAIELAQDNNLQIKSSTLNEKGQQQLLKSGFDIPKTEVKASFGQLNGFMNDKNLEITQGINPFIIGANKQLLKANYSKASLKKQNIIQDITREISSSWNTILFMKRQNKLLGSEEALLIKAQKNSSRRFETGDISKLQFTSAKARKEDLSIKILLNKAQEAMEKSKLKSLLQLKDFRMADTLFVPMLNNFSKNDAFVDLNSKLALAKIEVEVAKGEQKVVRAEGLPEIRLGYFLQSMQGTQEKNGVDVDVDGSLQFQGFTVGLALPIFAGSTIAKNKAAKTNIEMQELNAQLVQNQLETQLEQYQIIAEAYLANIQYYKETALAQAETIRVNSVKEYAAGQISYHEFTEAMDDVYEIENTYLESIFNYNQVIIEINYLINQ